MKPTPDVQKAYQKALVNKPVLDSVLNKVGQSTGGRVITNLKNPQTTVDKVQRKNEENPKRNYKIEDVNDVARGRLIYSDMASLQKGVQSFMTDVKTAGAKITKTQDYFTKPNEGYKGYHVDIKFPNGQTSEVQFHTVNTYANTLATHNLHEQYGDETPDKLAMRKEILASQIDKLSPAGAQKLAQPIEQQNAPAIQQAQEAAINAAQGQAMSPPNRGPSSVQSGSPMGPLA